LAKLAITETAETCNFNALNPAAAAVASGAPDDVTQRLSVDEFNDDVRLTCVHADSDDVRQGRMT